MKSQKVRVCYEFITWFLILATILIGSHYYQMVMISGNSMNPTYKDHNLVFIDKTIYEREDPHRYDIIVFSKKDDDTNLIKRIIGLPGETVQITENGYILINNKILFEEEDLEDKLIKDPGLAANVIQLNENEYFVLGDNRNNSLDSRSECVGIINKNDFIGKVIE